MKKLLTPTPASAATDAALLLARVSIAALMLTHGLPKLAMLFSGEPAQFPALLGLSPESALALTVFAEVVCSILLLVGFATRLAVIPLIITMLVAVLMVHGADPFAKQEMGIHYLVVYFILLLTGSGRYSIDYLVQRRSAGRYATA